MQQIPDAPCGCSQRPDTQNRGVSPVMHHRIGNQIDSFLTQHTHVHTETSTIQPTRAHANSKLFRSFAAHTLRSALPRHGRRRGSNQTGSRNWKVRLGGEGGNCGQRRLDCSSVLRTTSRLRKLYTRSRTQTRCLLFTRAPARLAEEVKGGWGRTTKVGMGSPD